LAGACVHETGNAHDGKDGPNQIDLHGACFSQRAEELGAVKGRGQLLLHSHWSKAHIVFVGKHCAAHAALAFLIFFEDHLAPIAPRAGPYLFGELVHVHMVLKELGLVLPEQPNFLLRRELALQWPSSFPHQYAPWCFEVVSPVVFLSAVRALLHPRLQFQSTKLEPQRPLQKQFIFFSEWACWHLYGTQGFLLRPIISFQPRPSFGLFCKC
jgi:hypothetical protein